MGMMMDSSSSQQETLESILTSSSGSAAVAEQQGKKPRPADQEALKCPRCDSANTKFCYYNNYSLSQPRYFCKSCRRYWTKGGTLRNVPVGGGCRKNKRASASRSSSKRAAVARQDPTPTAGFPKQQHASSSQGRDFGIWGSPNPELWFPDSVGIADAHHQDHPMFYEQMGIPFGGYLATTAVKQETCQESGEGSRALWGFPFGGDAGADVGIGGCSTWHGLM